MSERKDGGPAHTPRVFEPIGGYDFEAEAQRVIDAIEPRRGGHMTVVCALREAFEAGRAVNHHAALVEIAQESLAYAEQAGDKRRADYIRAVLASAQPTEAP